MGIRNDQGIVLRSYPFGEADRIVVLLSPNNGKIRTVAKGIRKTKSRFGGRLETFSHVDLQLYEGRNLDTITAGLRLFASPTLAGSKLTTRISPRNISPGTSHHRRRHPRDRHHPTRPTRRMPRHTRPPVPRSASCEPPSAARQTPLPEIGRAAVRERG